MSGTKITAKKVQCGYLFRVDGSVIRVRPKGKGGFILPELQAAVGGYVESLRPRIKGCRQMYCNEDGVAMGLPLNQHTEHVCNMSRYRANGYGVTWRVRGSIFAVVVELDDGATLPTIEEVLGISIPA